MGARFIATGAVRTAPSSGEREIFYDPNRPRARYCTFRMAGHWDVPVGPVIRVEGQNGLPFAQGVVEHVTTGHGRTEGMVRIVRPAEARRIKLEEYFFEHNYILRLNDPVIGLTPGHTFMRVKKEHRRYPIGSPIDLAIGRDFTIVGSVVVEETTVGHGQTKITARVLTHYSPEESALLTRVNQAREQANGRG